MKRLQNVFVGLVVCFCVGMAAPKNPSIATRVAGGDYPLNTLEVAGRYLISTNNGYDTHYLQAYDFVRHETTGKLELPSLWFGLAYEPQGNLLAASDGKTGIYLVPFDKGVFGRPRSFEISDCKFTAGLVVQDRTTAFVACNQSQEIVQFDLESGAVRARLQVGEFPFVLTMLPRNRLAVSNWGQSSVTVVDLVGLKKVTDIKVASHPNQMLVLPGDRHLAVTCSDSDSVSVIGLENLREIRRVDLRTPASTLTGVQPNTLAYGHGRLFVALAAASGVAVFRIEAGEEFDLRFEGVIPVGSFPTALSYSEHAKTLYIANGRNVVTGPNAAVPSQGQPARYIGTILGGGIEALTDAELDRYHARLETLAERIYGTRDRTSHGTEQHPPIKYIFYVIKENRTYDQVLGDMSEGNGSPELVLFGQKVTPNHHDLARQYILFDNFYVDGDVSADGHLWSTAGTSTEYVNRIWPMEYSKRAPGVLDAPYDGDAEHDHPIATPQSGFLWDRLLQAGISFRNYGEWYSHEDQDPSKMHTYLAGLEDHSDMNFRDDIGDITDQQRVDEWEREFTQFDANGQLPHFSLIYLPNDHTVGTRPHYRTPTAMVADNDLALGRVVERISKSRYWSQCVIFVLEDDAQDGPDHVDAHRSVMLMISPFTRRHAVSHRHYSTVSVVKTMAQLLGIGSLTYFDDRAPSLLNEFSRKPSPEAYVCLRPQVSIDEINTSDAPGAQKSSQWNFHGPDRAPPLELNRVIWQSVKGATSEPPPPLLRVAVPRSFKILRGPH
jgi:DNA-binding beta-propeller fold protein YncE